MLKFVGYFKNGTIIQRGESFGVNGYAKGKVTVSLSFENYTKKCECEAVDGKFTAFFDAVEDTKNVYTLSAECGREKIKVKVRFGDVYLTLGQSNMTYALGSAEDTDKWLKRAKKTEIGILDLHEKPYTDITTVHRPVDPLYDFIMDYAWQTGKDRNLAGVSAISVETAVAIAEKENIPVGVVHTSMGGLSVESYIPREVLEADKDVKAFTEKVGRYISKEDYNNSGLRNYTQLSGVWNEKIAPLFNLKFKAVVWYLGESSCWDYEFAYNFLKEIKMVISSLREKFGKIPFFAIQIAPEYYYYGDKYGYLYINEALSLLENEVEDVYTLPIYDIEPRWLKPTGEYFFHPIHPVNKSPISERVADALTGKNMRYPKISEVEFANGKAIVTVANAENIIQRDEYFGFTLAGEDGKYYPATAKKIWNNKLEVSSIDVNEPKYLTYGFMQYQDVCDVFSDHGLPMHSYRSVSEAVDEKRYYFPPAFTKNGFEEVYENNFSADVGYCQKVKVWSSGKIYRLNNAEITAKNGVIVCSCKPTKEKYNLFGISPEINLCGHRRRFENYSYLNFDLASNVNVTLRGVIVRSSDSEIYRLNIMNGENATMEMPVGKDYKTYTVCLSKGMGGDASGMDFDEEFRKKFVEMEFVFRSEKKAEVYIKNIIFSDMNLSEEKKEEKKVKTEQRSDIQLPTN